MLSLLMRFMNKETKNATMGYLTHQEQINIFLMMFRNKTPTLTAFDWDRIFTAVLSTELQRNLIILKH